MDVELNNTQEEIEMMYKLFELANAKKPFVKKYRKIRSEYEVMMERMVDYFYDHAEALSSRLDREIKQLQRNYRFGIRMDVSIQYEYETFLSLMIYPFFTSCVCDMMLKKKKVRSEKNIELVKNIRNSPFALYKVLSRDYHTCTVMLEDVLTGQQVKIIDERMSFDGKLGSMITARLITVQEFTFRTGVCYAFFEDDSDVLKWIKQQKKSKIETIGFIELYNLYQEKVKRRKAYVIKPQKR